MQRQELHSQQRIARALRKSSRFFKTSLSVGLAIYLSWHFLSFTILDRPLYEVKTNYLHWSSTLPAVSVCQLPSKKNTSSTVQEFLNNLEWPKERYCWKCSNGTNFPVNGYRRIVAKNVKRCPQLFQDCKWNGRKLDCCSAFKYLPTMQGICYSINSEMTGSRVKLQVSHYSKQGELSFSTSKDIQIYLHDTKDVWFTEAGTKPIMRGDKLDVLYRAREAVADHSARYLSLESRGCILPTEQPAYPVYSRSLCELHCLAGAQARRCACAHHLLPKLAHVPDCDLDGLICLDKYFSEKKEKKILNKCKCLPSCEEIEINIVWSNISRITKNETKVNLVLTTPPTEKVVLRARYQPVDILDRSATQAICDHLMFTVDMSMSSDVQG